jgi:serine/threonine-protein kinase
MKRTTLPALFAIVCLFCASPRARASGNAGETAAAQALFDQARALIEQDRFAEACPKLEESQRLDPAWGTLINLADCYEHVGRTASAWSRFIQVASGSRQAGQTARADAAKARAQALEERLSKLVISVVEADATAGIVVKRDGVVVGAAQWDAAVPVDPGEHMIEASAPGRRAWRTTVVVGARSDYKKVIVPSLEREPAKASEAPAPAHGAEAASSWSGMRIAGVTVGAMGAAALGVAGYFGVRALIYKHDSNETCVGNACTPEGTDLRNKALDAGNLATIFGIGGVISLAGGTVLYVVGRSPAAQPTVTVVGAADTHAARIEISGSF